MSSMHDADLKYKKIQYSNHVARRLFERNINYEVVKWIILHGEIIEEYSDDFPCPSVLYV